MPIQYNTFSELQSSIDVGESLYFRQGKYYVINFKLSKIKIAIERASNNNFSAAFLSETALCCHNFRSSPGVQIKVRCAKYISNQVKRP